MINIETKNLTYAKNMYVPEGEKPTEHLRKEQAQMRQDNKVRELKRRKEIFEFVDKMMNFMEDEGKQKGQLKITFIFEK